MRTHLARRRIRYDGSQLGAHWIYRTFGVVGDAVVGFRGPCAVSAAEMADLDDLLHGPGITGDDMVHLLLEVFGEQDLAKAVWRQRLLVAVAHETLVALGARRRLRRQGDDLWCGARKLSISVAAITPVSTVTHLGLNVVATGVPKGVRALGLADLGIEPGAFLRAVLAAFQAEAGSVAAAACLVRGKS